MKYLKRFNESTNEWYQEITSDKYYKLENHKLVPMSQTTIDKIKLLDRKGMRLDIISNNIPTNYPTYINIIKIGIRGIIIHEIEDEWFIINDFSSIDSRYNGPEHDNYYKCDQLEGLLKCLSDIL